jgi:hypothetical protein
MRLLLLFMVPVVMVCKDRVAECRVTVPPVTGDTDVTLTVQLDSETITHTWQVNDGEGLSAVLNIQRESNSMQASVSSGSVSCFRGDSSPNKSPRPDKAK